MTYPFHIDPRDTQGATDELTTQVQFRKIMRAVAPEVMLVAVPNAGKRSRWEAMQRGREGMVAGFPDLMALHQGRTALMEFKSGTGTLQDNQIDVLNKLVRQDFPVGVFRSADSAVAWLQGHWPHAFTGRIAA